MTLKINTRTTGTIIIINIRNARKMMVSLLKNVI